MSSFDLDMQTRFFCWVFLFLHQTFSQEWQVFVIHVLMFETSSDVLRISSFSHSFIFQTFSKHFSTIFPTFFPNIFSNIFSKHFFQHVSNIFRQMFDLEALLLNFSRFFNATQRQLRSGCARLPLIVPTACRTRRG